MRRASGRSTSSSTSWSSSSIATRVSRGVALMKISRFITLHLPRHEWRLGTREAAAWQIGWCRCLVPRGMRRRCTVKGSHALARDRPCAARPSPKPRPRHPEGSRAESASDRCSTGAHAISRHVQPSRALRVFLLQLFLTEYRSPCGMMVETSACRYLPF